MSKAEAPSTLDQLLKFFSEHGEQLELSDETIKKLCTHFVDRLQLQNLSDLRDVVKDDIPLKILKPTKRAAVLTFISENVQLREIKDGATSDTTPMRDFISRCDLSTSAELTLGDFLEDELECTTVSDFKGVGKGDIEIDISVVEINRFLRLFNEEIMGQPRMDSLAPSNAQEEASKPENLPVSNDNHNIKIISVPYIHYNKPKDVSCESITDVPETTTMLSLILKIMKAEGVDPSLLTLDLFSSQGYPLNNNDFTNECTLQAWKIEEKAPLYVFTRPKRQPFDCMSQSLPKVSHKFGSAFIEVSTQLKGVVQIAIDPDNESPEDLCMKVYSATNVPTTHMSLYLRDPNTCECTELNVNTKLKPGDTLTMVLKSPSEEASKYATQYGKSTYSMIASQTERGLSAFLSILRFVCEMLRSTLDFSKFLEHVLMLSQCPPLVYALKVLYEDHCCSLPCWAALFEGCFVLIKQWLSSFTDEGRIPDSKVFEFSDYFWAALLSSYVKKEQELIGSSFETTRMSLLCPASEIKIVCPVLVSKPGGDTVLYDKQSALEKKVFEDGCEMEEDEVVRDILMSNLWKTNREVLLWKSELPNIKLSKFECPYEWYELASCLDALAVSAPSHLLGMGSLTYNDDGQYVVYMGFAKDNDSGQVIFDPLKDKPVRRSKKDLCKIASDCGGKNVTSRDLTEIVNAESKNATPAHVNTETARPKPIKAEYGTNWTAKEAIMVIVDVSGSMDEEVYDTRFTRLDIAKQLFSAFRLRTQAYNLPNAVGLIGFGSNVDTLLDLNQCSEEFEKSLEKLNIYGRTALNDAMKQAADCLIQYKNQSSMPRRILCLTDGCDNGSSPAYRHPVTITQYLLEKKIIVDTVLIDDSAATGYQKAITHATGGACFKPDCFEAGLKLFEMEAFLSFKLRKPSREPADSTCISEQEIELYTNLSNYPFDEALECNALIVPLPKTSNKRTIGAGDLSKPGIKRITEELVKFKKSSQSFLEVFPSESNVTVWIVLMKGPEYTPYSLGAFLLQVKFPENYPSEPPEIRFHPSTPIYHCNISSTGRICHKILNESYCTRFDMRDILGSVYHLLMCPEKDDPLDSLIGETLSFDPDEYFQKAKAKTSTHALPVKYFTQIKENMMNGSGPIYPC